MPNDSELLRRLLESVCEENDMLRKMHGTNAQCKWTITIHCGHTAKREDIEWAEIQTYYADYKAYEQAMHAFELIQSADRPLYLRIGHHGQLPYTDTTGENS